jgi:lipopolysaccharide export system protein LptC
MRNWSRLLGVLVVIAVMTGAYFFGLGGRSDNASDTGAPPPPDPGYAAHDAQVIETGYDGRERYRLNAKVIRQQGENGVIDLDQLEMNYHPAAQGEVPGEQPVSGKAANQVWHLTSDHGLVQPDGNDVQLDGNVQVTGPAPGSDVTLVMTTDHMRVNTPTQFIQTDAPVRIRWSGNVLDAVGMEADLKAGDVRLKSAVHATSAH